MRWEGWHRNYLERGGLTERPDLLDELIRFQPGTVDKDYHEASSQEFADFQAMKKGDGKTLASLVNIPMNYQRSPCVRWTR